MTVHIFQALRLACGFWLLVVAASCGGGDSNASQEPEQLRIYHSPYGTVDWAADVRLKGQHHDHIGTNADRIRAYDAAGYHALSLIDYSGAPTLPQALKKRLWPVDAYLAPEVLAELRNIKVWFPSAEEVGAPDGHVNSPFLTTYIEAWDPARWPTKQDWQYQTTNELCTLIRAEGGLPVLAHPWAEGQRYASTPGLLGAEIYSAFAEAQRNQGVDEFVRVDRNRILVQNWDRALATNQAVIAFAVNDHFGPLPERSVPDEIRDSGKVIVLAKALTLEAYRAAIERGAVLAIRDMGAIKDQYPTIRSIVVEEAMVRIDTDGDVTWISSGSTIEEGPELEFSKLPSGSRYVRAEVTNGNGSIVYTQAFWVRPVDDADGDGMVTGIDSQICRAVAAGTDLDPDHMAACD